MITISLVGAFNGVGTTHTAISIANALALKNYKVCLIDRNYINQDIHNLGVELGEIEDEEEDEEGGYFTYNNVDYFLYDENFSLGSLKKNGYDYAVVDCGTEIDNFVLNAGQIILVSSSREWSRSRDAFYETCEKLDNSVGLENVISVFPFAQGKGKRELQDFCKENDTACIFTEFSDAFEGNFDITALNIEEKEKTSIFATLRKKKEDYEVQKQITDLQNNLSEFKQKYEDEKAEHENSKKKFEDKKSELENSITRYTSLINEQKEEINELNVQKETFNSTISEQQKAIEEEHYNAIHDKLTGCKNRLGYSEDLANYSIADVVIINFDVNNLKRTNDTLGHQCGDILITTISRKLTEKFKDVYRMGGDEFTVLSTKEAFEKGVLSALDSELQEITRKDTQGIVYQIAYGYEEGNGLLTFEEIYHNADLRMYEDKKAKKASPEELARLEEEKRLEEERIAEEKRLKEIEDIKRKEEIEKQSLEIERLKAEKEAEEERIRLEQERQKQMEAERIKAEEEAERQRIEEEERIKRDLENGLIPNTRWEHDEFEETAEEKNLATMWYVKNKLTFLDKKGNFSQHNVYIYPTDYQKPLATVPVIVVIETDGEYKIEQGTLIEANIGGYAFSISSRFMENGTLVASLYCSEIEDENAIKQETEVHNGKFTPKHFMKQIEYNGMMLEALPIKENIQGYCDCVIKAGDEIEISNGEEQFNDCCFRFYLEEKAFRVIRD